MATQDILLKGRNAGKGSLKTGYRGECLDPRGMTRVNGEGSIRGTL